MIFTRRVTAEMTVSFYLRVRVTLLLDGTKGMNHTPMRRVQSGAKKDNRFGIRYFECVHQRLGDGGAAPAQILAPF